MYIVWKFPIDILITNQVLKMENLNLAKLEEMNIIKENVALAASKELLGANDLPAKVKVIIDGKVYNHVDAGVMLDLMKALFPENK